jgi:hypothetical protein
MKSLLGTVRASDKSLLRAPELNLAREQAARGMKLQARMAASSIRPEKRNGLLRNKP